MLARAAAGPIWTKTSDIWGRKPALLGSVFLFAVSSIMAALSTNMPMLIAARAIQGTAAGGLFQLVVVTVSDLFSPRKRALYYGCMGAIWGIAGSTGPLLGGVFSEKLTWRWCFWINLPICGVSFALLVLLLDVHNPRTNMRDGMKAIDWYGTATMLAVTVLLLLGLNFGGGAFAWDSAQVIALIVVGTLMIAAFIFSEKRLATYPLMPLDVFTSRSNAAAFLLAFAHNTVNIGIEFHLPLFFQSALGASPLRSGLFLLPLMLTDSTVDISTGFFINRSGRYIEPLRVGAALLTIGTSLYTTFRPTTPLGHIIGFQMIGGAGTALLFQTPMLAIQASVPQAAVASATASLGFLNGLATAISIVLGGVVFKNSMSAQQSALAAAGLNSTVLEALSGDRAAANVEISHEIDDATKRMAVQEAFAWSLRNIFIMYAVFAGVALVASAFVRQRRLATEHTETKTGLGNLARRIGADGRAEE